MPSNEWEMIEGLSDRRREVFELVCRGYTNERIAEELFISKSTAGNHVSALMRHLDVSTRTQICAVQIRALIAERDAAPLPGGHR